MPASADEDSRARSGEPFARQAERWAARSLADLVAGEGFGLDPELARWWAAHGEVAWAEGQAEAWARRVVEWLQGRNQFLRVSVAEVAARIRGALARVTEVGAAGAVRSLREELAALVREQLGERPVEVVCSEYSPELQLRLLGLAVEGVRGPALDVGCGAAARLVDLLRGRGIAAEGIDRVRGDDWLDVRHYSSGRWATVLSHQALSLHFLHHHFRTGPTAMAYAQVYMEILRGLGPGGLFAYAPGLPFIEAMLPRSTYRVVRVPLPAALEIHGLIVEHATQVWRA